MIFGLKDFILLLPAILISLYAQYKVSSTFGTYLRMKSIRGLRGIDVARDLLMRNGLDDVRVEEIEGNSPNHYDPKLKVIRLSQAVYNGDSIAAVGIVAHETGHAVQHSLGYTSLAIRNTVAPIATISSAISWLFILIGIIFGALGGLFIKIGVMLFCAAVLFHVVTLPIEFSASKRALAMIEQGAYLNAAETKYVKKVLSAAAFTYVAAALVAIIQLIRLIILRGEE